MIELGVILVMVSLDLGGFRVKINWEIWKLEVILGEKRVIRLWSLEFVFFVVVSFFGSCIFDCFVF